MKYIVTQGTLLFEKGKFQKGDALPELTEEEIARLKGHIKAVEDPAPTLIVEVKPAVSPAPVSAAVPLEPKAEPKAVAWGASKKQKTAASSSA